MGLGALSRVVMIPVTLNIIGDSAIEWSGERLSGGAARLLALVLLLTLDGQKPRSRRSLESLLFDEASSEHDAAHSLRQLVYRLRRLGLEVTDSAGQLS